MVIELYSSERVVVDSLIKLRFHERGNSINHWNDLSSKERHLPLGSVMLVSRILISTSCVLYWCVYVTMLIRGVVDKDSVVRRTSVFITAW